MIVSAKSLKTALKSLYVVSVVVLILFSLRDVEVAWRSLVAYAVMPQAWGFTASWILVALSLGGLWSLWLKWRNQVHLLPSEWVPIQSLAWAGRYLPGKVGLLAGKLSVVGRSGLRYRDLGLSVFVEQFSFVATGFIVAIAMLDVHSLGWPSGLPTWIFANAPLFKLAGLVVLCSATVALISVLDRTLSTRAGSALPVGRLCILVALYTVPHLLVGSGFVWFVSGAFPHLGPIPYLHIVGLLALAHAAGSIAIFAPAGIGVREFVLAWGLATTFPFDQALLLATVTRVLTLLADVGLLVFLAAWTLSRRRLAPK